MSDWSDDRVELLKTLWQEGHSCSQIARRLGGVTRNAVIGKVTRMSLPGRASSAQPARPKAPTDPEPVVEEDGSRITTLTVNDRRCRWPIGDPRDADFYYCGTGPMMGSPYCEAHARKATQPTPPYLRDLRPRFK